MFSCVYWPSFIPFFNKKWAQSIMYLCVKHSLSSIWITGYPSKWFTMSVSVVCLLSSFWLSCPFFFILFYFFGCACGIQKFMGQGSNPSQQQWQRQILNRPPGNSQFSILRSNLKPKMLCLKKEKKIKVSTLLHVYNTYLFLASFRKILLSN